MTPVDEYIERHENVHQQHLIFHLHRLIMSFPDVSSKLRFKIPFYDGSRWICYINPIRKNGVEVCFIKGFKLTNRPQLEARKRTMVKGISIYEINDETLALIAEVFQEALELNKNS